MPEQKPILPDAEKLEGWLDANGVHIVQIGAIRAFCDEVENRHSDGKTLTEAYSSVQRELGL